MDDYSKSGQKTPRAAAKAREVEMRRQMSELVAIDDEATLIEALHRIHGIDQNHPKFKPILNAWRELRRRRP